MLHPDRALAIIAQDIHSQGVMPVVERLYNAGAKHVCLVGGFVRDALLGTASKDIDIEVFGLPLDRIALVLGLSFQVDMVGQSFGVLKVKVPGNKNPFDISVPRTDGVGRKPTITPLAGDVDFATAAARRNLTINAIMVRIAPEGQCEWIDPYNGMKNLAEGIIRAVTPESFSDDPLRVLIAFQQAARFGFYVNGATLELARNTDLSGLVAERVQEELNKALLLAPKPSVFFHLLDISGQLGIFPELLATKYVMQSPVHHPEGDAYTHLMLCVDNMASAWVPGCDGPRNLPMILAALLHDIGKSSTREAYPDGRVTFHGHDDVGAEQAELMLTRLRYPNDTIHVVKAIIKQHMRPHYQLIQLRDGKIKLKHLNHLLADLVGGYGQLMKRYDEALRLLYQLYSLAECDLHARNNLPPSHERSNHGPYEGLWELVPDRDHYIPKVTGQHLIEQGDEPGPAMGKRLVELYVNQINHHRNFLKAREFYAKQRSA